MAADEQSAPVLRVVNGDPTPEEVAAIVAVLASLGAAPAPAPALPKEWNAPRRLTQVTHPSGPGAWRSSGLPH